MGTVTVGADGSGKDVTFYSATAGDSFVWDSSEEKLTITGTNGQTALDVADGNLVVADNVDIEGDIDVNGTSNLDNTDIDGTLVVDGSNISLDSTTTLNIDNSNTSNGITIGTATSGVPISIGHSTSETTVNDNLVVTGDIDLEGSIDVNGTTNLDDVDIDGDVDISGSITNAAWTGDVIASAYLDADTAHLSGSQTFSGEKTFSANIIMADDTSIGISDSDERIEFDASGDISVLGANFGIGTDAPEAQVEIQGSSSASYAAGTVALANTGTLFIQNTDNTAAAFSQIVFGTRVSSVALTRLVSINVGSNDSDLAIVCNNSEKMRIDGSTGYVGIGTNNPLTKLHVVDTSSMKYENNSLTLTRDGGHLMVLKNSGSAIGDGEALGYYRFSGKVGSSDEEVGVSIQAEADGAWTNDTDCPARLEFHTNSGSGLAERMRIDKDGVITLHQGQLKFPATQNASSDANTLDDYEEGSWTPAIKAYGDDTKAMTMHSDTIGKYTKVGDMVHCTAYVKTSANGGVDSNLHIAIYGLPFTVRNDLAGRSGIASGGYYGLNRTAGQAIGGMLVENTVKIYLHIDDVDTGYSALLRDEWSTDGEWFISFSYKVA